MAFSEYFSVPLFLVDALVFMEAPAVSFATRSSRKGVCAAPRILCSLENSRLHFHQKEEALSHFSIFLLRSLSLSFSLLSALSFSLPQDKEKLRTTSKNFSHLASSNAVWMADSIAAPAASS